MPHPTLAWPLDALRTQLAPLLPGVAVEVVAGIDSTNSELMRRARAGRTAPTLLVAELQTAGRGRLGRGWQSGDGERGGALAFSLGLPLVPCDWSGLSLAVGLAVAESLHPDIRLKWPNDLWWQGRKLAGILVETAGTGQPGTGRYAVIGIGVNIAPLPGEGFATPPAWLQELLPGIDAPATLARIAAPLVQTVRGFEQGGFAPLAERFAARRHGNTVTGAVTPGLARQRQLQAPGQVGHHAVELHAGIALAAPPQHLAQPVLGDVQADVAPHDAGIQPAAGLGAVTAADVDQLGAARQQLQHGALVPVENGAFDARQVVFGQRGDGLVQRAAVRVVEELGRDGRRRGQQAPAQLLAGIAPLQCGWRRAVGHAGCMLKGVEHGLVFLGCLCLDCPGDAVQ